MGTRAETLDDTVERVINARGIRDQPDAFASDQLAMFFEQDVDAEFHRE